ncbi:hypothetical protein BDA99DRAFT_540786 [Phascolomyces articulosus]|uniref:Uncharacterized protein n=1 Tax=Phascolomyces articulosus TaxID=60185 RepID=A0AAD5K332_9FUNG|nr:hypothetical protein BDA99DRAFT_540786 [Phascolomyces articulosus]
MNRVHMNPLYIMLVIIPLLSFKNNLDGGRGLISSIATTNECSGSPCIQKLLSYLQNARWVYILYAFHAILLIQWSVHSFYVLFNEKYTQSRERLQITKRSVHYNNYIQRYEEVGLRRRKLLEHSAYPNVVISSLLLYNLVLTIGSYIIGTSMMDYREDRFSIIIDQRSSFHSVAFCDVIVLYEKQKTGQPFASFIGIVPIKHRKKILNGKYQISAKYEAFCFIIN